MEKEKVEKIMAKKQKESSADLKKANFLPESEQSEISHKALNRKTTESKSKNSLLNKNNNGNEKAPTNGMSLKKKILRSCIVLVVLAAVLLLGYYVLVWTGAWESINSVEKLRQLILSMGFWGRLTFVVIQFLQVTFLPIPSTISTLAGVLIYGPLETALLSLAGIMLGSVLAFALGRWCGRKLVVFMVGKETCEKWTRFLTNAKYSFFIMMLFPMFPDDVLCLVAGLTDMSWAFFVVTNLISRPIGIFLTCYLGSGQLIPYHGWGIAVWAVLIVLVFAVIILSYKFQPQIESFLQKKFRSHKEKIKKTFDIEAANENVPQAKKIRKRHAKKFTAKETDEETKEAENNNITEKIKKST